MSKEMRDIESLWRQQMFEVVSEVLENTAFTEVHEAQKETPHGGDLRGVSLLIHEPVQGELLLFMEEKLLTKLSTLVYGLEESAVAPEIEKDLLAELLNTIAGRFLAAILPPEEGFLLGVPNQESAPLSCPAPPCLQWNFTIEGRFMALILHGKSIMCAIPGSTE